MPAWTLLLLALGAARADPLTDCEPPAGTPVELRAATSCLYAAARSTGEVDRAIERVEQLAAEHPDSGWPRGTLASLYNMTDPGRAGPAYQQSATLFEAAGEYHGLTLSLLNLNTWHGRRGEIEEGRAALERARLAAEAHGDVFLLASVLSQAARWAAYFESDHFRARELGLETLAVAAELDDQRGYAPRLFARSALTHAHAALGLPEEAREDRRELIALAEARGDRRSLSSGLFDDAAADLEGWREGSRPRDEGEALAARLREVIEVADEAPNPPIAALARCALGSMLPGAEGQDLVDEGVAELRRLDYPEDEAECLIRGAQRLDPTQAPEIEALALAAAAAAARAEDPHLAIRARLMATQAAWEQDPERAREEGEATLALVEGYADRQRSSLARARLFGDHSTASYLHATRLRESGVPGEAFATGERMRGRELVLQLERAEALEEVAPDPEASLAYDQVLERLSAHQAALVSGEEEVTEAALAHLTRLEVHASRLRAEMLRSVPATGRLLASPTLLADVQGALAPGEALVTIQLPPANGDLFAPLESWAFVVTREALLEVPLPPRSELEERVDLYLGLLEARDPLAERAGERLHAEVVEPILAAAPGDVERLVFVLDGPLQRLPLAALAPEGGAPLGARMELARAPSANVWTRWRLSEDPRAPEVLALADPDHPGRGGPAAVTRALDWGELGALGELPHARGEAEDLVHLLGGAVWAGADASEAHLKAHDLSATGLLHLATHAVVDARYPDRSAVLLSPDPGGDDGLLQAREIADLRLPGTLVVLSACQSATGALVDGEGVVGLSRAFVLAGASGVLGSLWPIRDDEARAFFEVFYAHLATGARPGAALRETRRDLHASGAPAHAWAGVVLIGDPAHHMWSGTGTRPTPRLPLAWLLGTLMVGVLGVRTSWRSYQQSAEWR